MWTEQQERLFFTWTAQKSAKPMAVKRAQGVHIDMEDGQRLIDMTSFVFNASIGHGHPAIAAALRKAAENPVVTHPLLFNEERAILAKNLARITPFGPFVGLTKSFLSLGGADANEMAVKMARMYTGKYKVVTRYRSFHGATIGTMAMSGDYRRIPFDMHGEGGIVRIPDPYPRGSKQEIDTVKLLEEIIEVEGPETIACVLLEGITGANGVLVPPVDYWPRIREICDRYKILLISDEVMSGFGRTGKWFAVDHYGVTPDMITMGKGLTGGYAPLGAVSVNEKIASFFDDNTLWCGLTSYAHPLCCTVANATIEVYEKEKLVENAAKQGEVLAESLHQLKRKHGHIAEVRHIGLLAAIELRKSPTDERPFVPLRAKGEDAKPATELQQAFYEAGVMAAVRFSNVLLAPPLCITTDELMQGIERIDRALTTLQV